MRPLNILVPHCSELLTDYQAHGDGRIAHYTLTQLARRGHRITAFTQQMDLQQPLPSNITVHLIEGGNLVRQRLHYATHLRRQVQQLLATQQFDIAHQLNPVYNGISLGLVGFHIPLVLGCYGARWPHDPDSAVTGKVVDGLRNLSAVAQQLHADALLLSTRASETQLPLPSLVRHKTHIVPYGLDTQLFSPDPAHDADDGHTVLYLASLNRRKGIYGLLEAMPAIVAAVPAVRFRIAGKGPEKDALQQRAAQLGVDSHIEWLGSVSTPQTIQEYRRCTLLVQPSHGEPFGMSPLEAMACGKPIVVTRTGGLGQYTPVEGAIKIDESAPEQLAQAVITLLQSPALRQQMGSFNRRYAVEHFDWSHVIDSIEAVYQKVLSEQL